MTPVPFHLRGRLYHVLFLAIGCTALTACDNDQASDTASDAATSTVSQSFTVDVADTTQVAPADAAVLPSFHVAPVLLHQPSNVDAIHPGASASLAPHTEAVPAALAMLSTRRLTWTVMQSVLTTGVVPADNLADPSNGTASSATVYTPAQIRAAYQEPPLPTTTSVTAAQAASLGAGQTIYLIDAMDDPNAAAELAAFNSTFGLPSCTTTSIAPAASLPLAAAPLSGCTFSVVYATTAGKMTGTAPSYDSGWATEIALDVQWAHATAPYARLVLIEASDSSVATLSAAVQVANSMGAGIVSQSFGSAEGNWTATVDSVFQVAHMTYLAAAGDAGAAVNWPAVSPNVLAVGGTSLTYSGSGSRAENTWSGTGGGVSAYTATPTYQTEPVPNLAGHSARAVTDVSFNADPYTGLYVAQLPPGATSPGWIDAGGTSAATPQWAGVLAVANAMRTQNNATLLGLSQSLLYSVSAGAESATEFLDITLGADGTCSSCYAGVGYDLPTGLGTPNVSSLLNSLSGPKPAPTVAGANVSGQTGTVLTFEINATAPDAVIYRLVSAPPGMTVDSTSGLVTWTAPIAGGYSIVAQATDTTTGLSGDGTITAVIAKPGPVITVSSVSGRKNVAVTGTGSVTDTTPGKIKIVASGMPKGMTFTSSGSSFTLKWPKPVKGHYSVTLTATDAKGVSGTATISVTITA